MGICNKCKYNNCRCSSSTVINSDRAGRDGLSAYDLAVKTNKFTGSEAEFVEWNKGKDGDAATLVFNTLTEMRLMSASEIKKLKAGVYKAVRVLGYYEKDDTSAALNYYVSTTSLPDNNGSVIYIGDIKLEHNFNGIVDARYYGIFGGTGEYVHELINRMINSSPEKTKFIFGDGEHLLNDYIDITKDYLEFSGSLNTTFNQKKEYCNAFLVTSAKYINFNNFTIQQNTKAKETQFPYGFGSGITYWKSDWGEVRNVTFYNCGDHTNTDPTTIGGCGVYRSSSNHINVIECKFYRCRMGVGDDDYLNKPFGDPERKTCSYNDLVDSYFEDCWFGLNVDFGGEDGGVEFVPGIIDNCKFRRISYGKSAIESKKFKCVKPIIINNVQITGVFAEGIAFLFGSYYDKIIGGYIDRAYDGIALYQQNNAEPTRYITVDGMTIKNCLNAGITSNASYDCIVSNCDIVNNKYGLHLRQFTWNMQLLNNNISRNTYAGVRIDEALGCKIIGGQIINNSTNVEEGTGCGIIINEPNITGRITGIEVRNVTFDYSFSSSNPIPATNQINAIKTIGNYYTYNAITFPGVVEGNYFGRCSNIESQAEGTNTAIIYRANIRVGQRYNDFNQRINISSRKIVYGNGSPNGVLIGSPGDIYVREDIAENPIYFKELTTDNQNWVPQNSFISKRVTDLNDVTGYVILRTTNDCLNAPVSGYLQGIQYSGNNDPLYLNQLVYDLIGNCFERSKNNGVWSSWVARDSSKFTSITTTSVGIFSGSRNQYVVQNSSSSITNNLVTDVSTFAGLYKRFKNIGSGNMVIQPNAGVTVNGSTSAITLIKGENLTILSTGVNTYITLDRYFDGVPAYSTKPTLANGERIMIIDTTTNKPLWGLGTSGATEWRDATGTTV